MWYCVSRFETSRHSNHLNRPEKMFLLCCKQLTSPSRQVSKPADIGSGAVFLFFHRSWRISCRLLQSGCHWKRTWRNIVGPGENNIVLEFRTPQAPRVDQQDRNTCATCSPGAIEAWKRIYVNVTRFLLETAYGKMVCARTDDGQRVHCRTCEAK